MTLQPTAVDAQAESVEIKWSDDVVHQIDNVTMRLACPCATCNDQRLKDGIPVPDAEIRIMRMFPIGGYALGFEWSDGHSTGFYSYQLLRELGA